jgi:hypothetical protein
MPTKYGWRFVLGASVLLIFASRAVSGTAQISEGFIRSSVDFCRGYPPAPPSEPSLSLHMSDDKTILCYGGIYADQDLSVMHELSNGGIFVIRSRGGIPASAIKIANILESKMATVVIRDYCMSACAGFIYIATVRTYVVGNSVVAWHAPYQRPPCDSGFAGSAKTIESWISLPAEVREDYCKFWALQSDFFKKRGDPAILFLTKSAYVSRRLTKLADNHGLYTNQLFWMWHPRYHDNLTTKVTYESYPRGQDEVDEIARKFGLSKIIYDP